MTSAICSSTRMNWLGCDQRVRREDGRDREEQQHQGRNGGAEHEQQDQEGERGAIMPAFASMPLIAAWESFSVVTLPSSAT